MLKDWPAGYQMYDHNKGPADRPRHDPYLVGSTHVGRIVAAAAAKQLTPVTLELGALGRTHFHITI